MKELTENTPKPLLEVAGKTLLEHKLDTLPDSVDEIIIIVGYLGSKIHDRIGGIYKNRRVLYVEQEDPTGGTAEALWLAKDLLHDRFFVMNGDNLYAKADLEKCADLKDWVVLVQEREHVGTGRVVVDSHMHVKDIAENSEHKGERGYANTGMYVLDTRVFKYEPVPKAKGSKELGLPQTFIQGVDDVKTHAVAASMWVEIKSPSDLKKAEEVLSQRS